MGYAFLCPPEDVCRCGTADGRDVSWRFLALSLAGGGVAKRPREAIQKAEAALCSQTAEIEALNFISHCQDLGPSQE